MIDFSYLTRFYCHNEAKAMLEFSRCTVKLKSVSGKSDGKP